MAGALASRGSCTVEHLHRAMLMVRELENLELSPAITPSVGMTEAWETLESVLSLPDSKIGLLLA